MAKASRTQTKAPREQATAGSRGSNDSGSGAIAGDPDGATDSTLAEEFNVRHVEAPDKDDGRGVPKVGHVLRGLRQRNGMSLKEVADGSGLSVSFLSAVERDQSDISLGRLNRLAQFFNHDIGSLLGYTGRRSTPQFVSDRDRLVVDRGEGVDYRVFRLPGLDFELITATFGPHTEFRDAITHEGLDIVYVLTGQVVLEYNGEDYPMHAGDCTMYSGAYPHRFRNVTGRSASWLSIVTGIVY
jgi:transcriptional regulator with XRE-family HTH domain